GMAFAQSVESHPRTLRSSRCRQVPKMEIKEAVCSGAPASEDSHVTSPRPRVCSFLPYWFYFFLRRLAAFLAALFFAALAFLRVGGQPFFFCFFAIEALLNRYRVMSSARSLNDRNSVRDTQPSMTMMMITNIVMIVDGSPFVAT